MKIQDQTYLSDKEKKVYGNCLATCYACYFDIEANNVPQFQFLFDCKEPEGYWDRVVGDWLSYKGYKREFYPPETEPSQHGHDDYYFAYGLSPRGIMHQVIYKNGILFHDPHPSHDGLVEIKGYEVLKPLSLTK